LALALPLAGPAQAKTVTVNTTADTPDANVNDLACTDVYGMCSLRAAIMQLDMINFPNTVILPAGTFTLSISGADENSAATGDLDLLKAFTINGSTDPLSPTVINATPGFGDRIFDIPAGVNQADTFSHVTISDGVAPPGENGGGIQDLGATSLTFSNVTLSGNSAPTGSGGGLYVSGAIGSTFSVPLVSTFSNNTAGVEGGGLDLEGTVSATMHGLSVTDNSAMTGAGMAAFVASGAKGTIPLISDSTFTGNSTPTGGAGGGMAVANTTLTANTVSGNSATFGGGIELVGGTSPSTILNFPVTENTATLQGGGLYTKNCKASCGTILDMTFDSNSAPDGAGAYMNDGAVLANDVFSNNTVLAGVSGGALYHAGGSTYPLKMTNVTIANNMCRLLAAWFVDASKATDTLTNVSIGGDTGSVASIVVLPTAAAPKLKNTLLQGVGVNCTGRIVSLGHNLDSGNSCSLNQPGDLINTDPTLAGLGDWGGPVRTLRLDWGSPAIDTGDSNGCATTDARNVRRPQDGDHNGSVKCDIGAYEAADLTANAQVTVTETAAPTSVHVGDQVTYTTTLTNTGETQATVAMVSDRLPASLTLTRCSVLPAGAGSCGGTGQNRTVTFQSIPNTGLPYTVTIVVTVISATPATVINTVSEFASNPDRFTYDNTSSATITVSTLRGT